MRADWLLWVLCRIAGWAVTFAAWLLVFIAVLLVSQQTQAQERRVEAWTGVTHTSNLFRGCPLRCGQDELTEECVMGGITLTAGRRRSVEIDLSHGSCRWEHLSWRPASQLAVRFYPGRTR